MMLGDQSQLPRFTSGTVVCWISEDEHKEVSYPLLIGQMHASIGLVRRPRALHLPFIIAIDILHSPVEL
jgi:hypothetical protein